MAADSQPFSPSDFLNLPPTPGLDVVDDDDLVLPFISRMLMEEETDGCFVVDPDHPALLQAQQPFADILSGAGAGANSTTTGSNSNSAAANTTPAAFANATWPYDPVELSSQLLLSRTRTYPSGADSPASSTMFGFGTAVTMDMLNLAFLKGMEEANKLLPTSSLLMPIVSGDKQDGDRDKHQPWKRDGNNGISSSLLMPQHQQSANNNGNGSRGRKNHRHDVSEDDDETSTGRRSCKVMAAESEESQMVEEFVKSAYQLIIHKEMMAMTLDNKSKSSSSSSSKGKKGSATEAVDLRTLLIHCAEAVAAGDRPSATDLLGKIRERASPRGDATQRLAHYFAKGLEARLEARLSGGTRIPKRVSALELLKANTLHLTVCCFRGMGFKFSNMAICNAIAVSGRNKVHIVDYGDCYGYQWPSLLGHWGGLKGGPPEVRITAIAVPQPGFRPAARIQDTARRLADFARWHGVPSFRFHSIVATKWEEVSVDDLNIEHDEVLVVNGSVYFGKLKDEGADIDSLSPRDMVLANIRNMRPDVFILYVENSSYNVPFFVTRFREALFFYSALFDMMDVLVPRDNDERVLVEQELFGHRAFNAIACEGSDRVERPETYRQWQLRNDRAGLRQLPLDPDIVKAVRKKVKDNYHKDFVVDVDQQWLLQGWKGRILYAMSTWVANDNNSSIS